MKVKLVLCDFDGTITQADVLDMICDLVGKQDISQRINSRFAAGEKDGKEALIERFSLLEGLECSKIDSVLDRVPLTNGAEAFFEYTQKHRIKTLVLSGNADFVLKYFKSKLHFSDFSGSTLCIRHGKIQPWDPNRCKCVDKQTAAATYIKKLGLKKEEIMAIGDSVADEMLFALAGVSFLINQKSQMPADYVVSSFYEIISYLEKG